MSTPQKIRCRVSKLINHGGHVFTVELIPDKPSPRFKAGQFLHLALDAYDPSGFWPESRVFSIASPPDSRERLLITYSVKGDYTTRMENELAVGKEVWIKLPYGEFIIDPSRPVVLVAGGTGITAFTAFLEALSENTSTPIHMFYGAREKDLLIFRKILEEKQKSVQNLTVFYFIEISGRRLSMKSKVSFQYPLFGQKSMPGADRFLSFRPASDAAKNDHRIESQGYGC